LQAPNPNGDGATSREDPKREKERTGASEREREAVVLQRRSMLVCVTRFPLLSKVQIRRRRRKRRPENNYTTSGSTDFFDKLIII
jgi:hypothetical protein